MRTAFLILALSALSAFGQAFSFNDPAWMAQQQKVASGGGSNVGTVFTDNFNRASLGTNWDSVGTPNATIVGNQLQMNNTGTTWGSLIKYNQWKSMADHWRWEIDEIVPASGFGGALAYYNATISANYHDGFWLFWVNLNNNPAELQILSVPSGFATANSWSVTTGLISHSPGDTLHLVAQRTTNCFEFWATNVTTGAWGYTNHFTDIFASSAADTSPHNYGNRASEFAVWQIGATTVYDNALLTENIATPVNYVIYGDSITAGLYATSMANRWANKLGVNFIMEAAPGAASEDFVVTTNEAKLYQPVKVFVMIGGNDVWDTTTSSYYSNAVNALTSQGALVYHCLPTPRNTGDPATFRSWLKTVYPTTFIDTYSPLTNNTGGLLTVYDGGDGVHPNNAGETNIAWQIIQSGKL